jgi:hypothetical protein
MLLSPILCGENFVKICLFPRYLWRIWLIISQLMCSRFSINYRTIQWSVATVSQTFATVNGFWAVDHHTHCVLSSSSTCPLDSFNSFHSNYFALLFFPQNMSCFRPNLLLLHINKSMLFTVTTNILALNFSVEWILLILCKCVILFKTFTMIEFRFLCSVTTLKQFLCYHIAPFCCCILQSPCCDFCIWFHMKCGC